MEPVERSSRKKVVIAGGGSAGLEAAVAAAKKGHHVCIYEKSDTLGGQWLKAAVPSAKQDFTTLVSWCKIQLEKMGVPIYLNTEYTSEIHITDIISPFTILTKNFFYFIIIFIGIYIYI